MPPTIIDLTLAKSPSPAPVRTTAEAVVAKKPLVNAVLLEELATTSEDRLRRLAKPICRANSEAARMAADTLLVLESEVNLSAEESTEDEWDADEEDEDGEDERDEGETEEKKEELNPKEKTMENKTSSESFLSRNNGKRLINTWQRC